MSILLFPVLCDSGSAGRTQASASTRSGLLNPVAVPQIGGFCREYTEFGGFCGDERKHTQQKGRESKRERERLTLNGPSKREYIDLKPNRRLDDGDDAWSVPPGHECDDSRMRRASDGASPSVVSGSRAGVAFHGRREPHWTRIARQIQRTWQVRGPSSLVGSVATWRTGHRGGPRPSDLHQRAGSGGLTTGPN